MNHKIISSAVIVACVVISSSWASAQVLGPQMSCFPTQQGWMSRTGFPCPPPQGRTGPMAYAPPGAVPQIQISPAQRLALQCAARSGGDVRNFAACAGGQIVLNPTQQQLVKCAAQSGSVAGFAGCAGGRLIMSQLNPEQRIAVQCIAETGGQPYAAAACTATRLTTRELQKCFTDGIGGARGCFGDNNDLVGRNGWTARTLNNIVNDVTRGPGPNNDLVGRNGWTNRTLQNMGNDVRNGPGRNNDLVGCNGAIPRLFGSRC